jgi:hypothetical protein
VGQERFKALAGRRRRCVSKEVSRSHASEHSTMQF